MKLSEELYALNSQISLRFVALKQTPSYEDMCVINEKISKAIIKLREYEEEENERNK